MKTQNKTTLFEDLYVYYLQLDNNLGRDYISLAAAMKSFGVTLVPVKAQELDYYVRHDYLPLLAITDTLERSQRFKKLRREYLDFALRGQDIYLFHLNSFGRLHGLEQLEKLRIYNPLPLPVSLQELFSIMIERCFSKRIKEKEWPGGRRVGLTLTKE